jgi:hypothetical protein
MVSRELRNDPRASTAAANLAKLMQVDSNAPLTPEQAARVQAGLDGYMKRQGIERSALLRVTFNFRRRMRGKASSSSAVFAVQFHIAETTESILFAAPGALARPSWIAAMCERLISETRFLPIAGRI